MVSVWHRTCELGSLAVTAMSSCNVEYFVLPNHQVRSCGIRVDTSVMVMSTHSVMVHMAGEKIWRVKRCDEERGVSCHDMESYRGS